MGGEFLRRIVDKIEVRTYTSDRRRTMTMWDDDSDFTHGEEPKCRYCTETREDCQCFRGPCMTKDHEILRIALAIRGKVAGYESWLDLTDLHMDSRVQCIVRGYMRSIYEMAHSIAQLTREETCGKNSNAG